MDLAVIIPEVIDMLRVKLMMFVLRMRSYKL
jgi:hypothetical protein